jgi:hypothetical protein
MRIGQCYSCDSDEKKEINEIKEEREREKVKQLTPGPALILMEKDS